jgi:predicted nucleic acid-binding protein
LIVVDTSVWIDAHRRPGGRCGATLRQLIDADEVALALPVRLELVAGVSRRDRAKLLRGLSSLPVLRPGEETWPLIERWLPLAADRGWRFGVADWLIAALAHEIGALVWSLDDDFDQLSALKMARLYAPGRT